MKGNAKKNMISRKQRTMIDTTLTGQRLGKGFVVRCVRKDFPHSTILECTKVNLRSLVRVVQRRFVLTFSCHHIT